MPQYESIDLVDKILSSDHNDARDVFNSMLNDRILSELEAKRVELAANILPTDERQQNDVVRDKATQIYQEVDPHTGQEVEDDNEFDVD